MTVTKKQLSENLTPFWEEYEVHFPGFIKPFAFGKAHYGSGLFSFLCQAISEYTARRIGYGILVGIIFSGTEHLHQMIQK